MSVHCEPETCQLLLRLDLFRGLEAAELVRLLTEAELIECRAGKYPIREGEQDIHLFIILAGKAAIYKRSLGVNKLIKELGPGECFGEMSLIECRSRSASVRAITHCRLLRLDGAQITKLPDIASKLFRNIARLLSQRLRHANDLLTLG
ncbi:MAG TPA: cyclic nucleotide-binding domain-containing protein [Noviherbaspirillum sp.]|uniref:cyclic nucleotide-binding domain-containing protein n=1 Tax=Noviherbaspirillum sp. TaxID=1926288 RepID=UPI002D602FE9|nr:cyclic nucleotide-binding domain-containing protein [Noviherbaspirillum sp.]HYD96510.1 cyclic nucleotide-binding domain-containing protein [Noviherbaspirillum sp.]